MAALARLAGGGALRQLAAPAHGAVAGVWAAAAGNRAMASGKGGKPRARGELPDHIPSKTIQIKQRRQYKDQVRALRKQFMAELAADAVEEQARRARMATDDAAVAEEAQARREERRRERRVRSEALDAARREAQEVRKADASKALAQHNRKIAARMEDSFATLSLDSTAWVADPELAEGLINEALLNPYKPHARPSPQGGGGGGGGGGG